TASIWLEIPNIGQIAAIAFACRKYHHPAQISAVDRIADGHQSVFPSFGCTHLPIVSCSKNRPTRVPVSIVVRMNNASNMIAKWYQYLYIPATHGGASPSRPI